MKLGQENKWVEYKAGRSEIPKDFWETYSAFANTDGGTVYLGIDEPKKHQYEIVGVKNPEKRVTDLWNGLCDPRKVSVNLLTDQDVEIINEQGKSIIKISIPEASYSQKPVYINGHKELTFKRFDDGDRKATEEQYKYMVVNSHDDLDNELLNGYDLDDINTKDVLLYKEILIQNTGDIKYSDMSIENFLINLGAMKRDRHEKDKVYKITVGGLLFFGKYNSIISRFPKFQLDYYRKMSSLDTNWKDRVSTGDKDTPEMNIFSFYMRVIDKLTDSISDKFELNEDLTRSSYHGDLSIAVKEALINSLMHAYYDSSEPIRIYNYDDYFEFYNPGDMKISKEEFIHGGTSKIRNGTISIIFRRAGFSERAGSGGPRIFDAVQKHKLKTPEIFLTDESTRVRIWRYNMLRLYSDLPENENTIIQYMIAHSYINKSIAIKKLKLTDYKFRTSIDNLIDQKIIEKVGHSRSTAYILVDSEESDIIRNKKMLKELEDKFNK